MDWLGGTALEFMIFFSLTKGATDRATAQMNMYLGLNIFKFQNEHHSNKEEQRFEVLMVPFKVYHI